MLAKRRDVGTTIRTSIERASIFHQHYCILLLRRKTPNLEIAGLSPAGGCTSFSALFSCYVFIVFLSFFLPPRKMSAMLLFTSCGVPGCFRFAIGRIHLLAGHSRLT